MNMDCIYQYTTITIVHEHIAIVATFTVVLHWLCDSPRTGCAWRTTPYIYVARTSNNRVIMACELYCCLLPQCKALRICRSGFPIATKWCCDRDVKVVRSLAFTKRTCDQCGSLQKGGDVVATFPVVLHWLCDSPRTGCAWRTTTYIYVAWTSNNRVIMACELYCCLLPQCEALRVCRSGFPIATLSHEHINMSIKLS